MLIRIRPAASDERARKRLRELVQRGGDDYAGLSRLLGRNAAYLQQCVKRGTPRRLDEQDRLVLAQYFQIDERELGAREPWSPSA